MRHWHLVHVAMATLNTVCTSIHIDDGLAQGVADGGQRGRDGLGALVQRVALARLLICIAPLLLHKSMH